MKITVERKSLMPILEAVALGVESRSTVPILQNCLIEAKDGKLSLATTDMDVLVRAICASGGRSEAGCTTVDMTALLEAVRALDRDAVIELAEDGGNLAMRSGETHFDFRTLPAEDFPAMADKAYDHWFTIGGQALLQAVHHVRSAIGTEEARYYLNGVYFHVHGDGLRLVATDGHRLNVVEPEILGLGQIGGSAIVPRIAVAVLAGLVGQEESVAVSIAKDDTTRWQIGDRFTLTSKSIDGTFPDYEKVIPTSYGSVATIQLNPFADAIRRAVVMGQQKCPSVKLIFDNGALEISASSPEKGEARETMEIEYAGGEAGDRLQGRPAPRCVEERRRPFRRREDDRRRVAGDLRSQGRARPLLDSDADEHLSRDPAVTDLTEAVLAALERRIDDAARDGKPPEIDILTLRALVTAARQRNALLDGGLR